MRYADVYVKTKADVPTEDHWAIFKFSSYHVPGDERSRTNPGHGYPARDEPVVEYQAYTTEGHWKEAIADHEQQGRPYLAAKVCPAKVSTKTTVIVE